MGTAGAFSKGLHEVGNGVYAYLQPDGTWGLSNAGLISAGGEALLVDTLMDVQHTADMLATMRARVPAAQRIEMVVNTHGNPDHFFGNELVADSRIIASAASLPDMRRVDPNRLAGTEANWQDLGDAGAFFHETMGQKFDFRNITVTLPTETFETETTLSVGGKAVHLRDLGPAHTRGDAIAYVPADRVVFTGDLLFHKGHPIIWAGPVGNWIAACDYLLGLDVEVIVPGHGPLADKSAVDDLKSYLLYLRDEARVRFDAGIGFEEAARDIVLDAFSDWSDSERVVANVFALYREFRGESPQPEGPDLFAAMGRYRKAVRSVKA
jgi:cyclase